MTKSPDKCLKEGEIVEAKILAQQALQQSQHIYTQLEELRNTLQHLCFSMMNCRDDHRKELANVTQQLHTTQLQEMMQRPAGSTSIQVNPTIDVGDKGKAQPDKESAVSVGKQLSIPLALCLGAGTVVGMALVIVFFVGKALKWF